MSAVDPGAFLGLEGDSCGPSSLGVVIPVPYEATTTYKTGTLKGPSAILEASQQVEFYDEWLEDEAQRFGIRTLAAVEEKGSPEQLADHLEAVVSEQLQAGRFPLILGGEHSISLGPIRAAAQIHPDLVVLHLDAHPDLRNEYEGTRYGHGCVMRRVLEAGVRIHAFGLRAISPEERDFYPTQQQATYVGARELLPLSGPDRVARILQDLPDGPLWLSWDIDGLDPSIVPNTGTPEPGGLDWYTVSELLRKLDLFERQIVGAELVELMPVTGQHASDFACARLAHRMILAGLRSKHRNP
ncbi:MAG: agmatinase [Planctomycetes bacterium]|nr:agmatinase [Planctomycetota bacterium]MCP4771610.1 agmatinase [Planctomycetota bacterium]MCP4860090.1 agmatinase [Planctomycetota bacterium]